MALPLGPWAVQRNSPGRLVQSTGLICTQGATPGQGWKGPLDLWHGEVPPPGLGISLWWTHYAFCIQGYGCQRPQQETQGMLGIAGGRLLLTPCQWPSKLLLELLLYLLCHGMKAPQHRTPWQHPLHYTPLCLCDSFGQPCSAPGSDETLQRVASKEFIRSDFSSQKYMTHISFLLLFCK